MKKTTVSSLMLLLAAMIWGLAFVAQSAGMEYIGPFTFLASRCAVASVALLPVSLYSLKRENKQIRESKEEQTQNKPRDIILGGAACGVLLFMSSAAQQIGIVYTSVGKAGFITALYLIIVPVLGLLWGIKPKKKVWFCAFGALFGMYLLCISGAEHVNKGDICVLICAVMFSFHILTVNKYSKRVNAVVLNNLQFFVVFIISLFFSLILEKPELSSILEAYVPVLYAGILSSGVAYTIQISAQKHVAPALASLIMSLESVFSAVFGFLLLHEVLTIKEALGCLIVFVSVLLADAELIKKRSAIKG